MSAGLQTAVVHSLGSRGPLASPGTAPMRTSTTANWPVVFAVWEAQAAPAGSGDLPVEQERVPRLHLLFVLPVAGDQPAGEHS